MEKFITGKIPSVTVCSILYCYQSIFRPGYAMGTTWLYLVRADDVFKFVDTGKARIMTIWNA